MSDCVGCGATGADVKLRPMQGSPGHTYRALLCTNCSRGTATGVPSAKNGTHLCRTCGAAITKKPGPGRYPAQCVTCR